MNINLSLWFHSCNPAGDCYNDRDHNLKKMFVANLPADASEDSVRNMFSEYGKVHAIHLNMDIFTGRCRGFGTVAMEGHEARAAMAELDGKFVEGKQLKVRFEDNRKSGNKKRSR